MRVHHAAASAALAAELVSDRTPTAEGEQKRGAVRRTNRSNGRVFVAHFEAVELDQECFLGLGVRVEHIERAELDRQDRLGQRGLDTDGVQTSGTSTRDRNGRLRSMADAYHVGAGSRARRHERCRLHRCRQWRRPVDGGTHAVISGRVAEAAGGSVVKKRAICWSNMYVEPVTAVAARSGGTPQ